MQTAHMTIDPTTTDALRESLARLRRHPETLAAVERLQSAAAAIDKELARTVLARIPAFAESGNPEVLPDMRSHAADHRHQIIGLLRDGYPLEFGFVERHARRRAGQRFPLEHTLHAYRCGHRVFLRWIRDSLAVGVASGDVPAAAGIADAATDFTMDYTDTISTIATAAYVDAARQLAEAEGHQRRELLDVLLEGHDESDGRVASLLRGAGYLDSRRAFCVLLGRSVPAAEMQYPARSQRLADSIAAELCQTRLKTLIGIREHRVVAVVSDLRRASGWSPLRRPVGSRVAEALALLGIGVVVGISNDVPSTARLPQAFREAQRALDCCTVQDRILRFAELPLPRLLLQAAGDELPALLPAWHAAFNEADHLAEGSLSATIQAYADADMNALRAAARLGIHPNTLHARLRRIAELTGQDARRFHTLSNLLLVACAAGNRSRHRSY